MERTGPISGPFPRYITQCTYKWIKIRRYTYFWLIVFCPHEAYRPLSAYALQGGMHPAHAHVARAHLKTGLPLLSSIRSIEADREQEPHKALEGISKPPRQTDCGLYPKTGKLRLSSEPR